MGKLEKKGRGRERYLRPGVGSTGYNNNKNQGRVVTGTAKAGMHEQRTFEHQRKKHYDKEMK